MEHVRGFPDDPYPLVVPLGLFTCLLVLLDYSIVELRVERTGVYPTRHMDIFHRQTYQNARPLHPTTRRLPPATALDCIWLPAWLHQAPWSTIYKRGKLDPPRSENPQAKAGGLPAAGDVSCALHTDGSCRPHGVAAKEPTATMRIAWFVSRQSKKSTSSSPSRPTTFDDLYEYHGTMTIVRPAACLLFPRRRPRCARTPKEEYLGQVPRGTPTYGPYLVGRSSACTSTYLINNPCTIQPYVNDSLRFSD